MLSKIWFATKASWHNRALLCAYLWDPRRQIPNIRTLTAQLLLDSGVQVLILDYDGVLAAHGRVELSAQVAAWLSALRKDFVGRIYILSNNPSAARREYFREHYPEIGFISGVRKKPYPDGVMQILAENPVVSAQAVWLVDDRLATGILAAVVSGIYGLWVTEPLVDLRGKFWAELWFMGLRSLDRALLRCAHLF